MTDNETTTEVPALAPGEIPAPPEVTAYLLALEEADEEYSAALREADAEHVAAVAALRENSEVEPDLDRNTGLDLLTRELNSRIKRARRRCEARKVAAFQTLEDAAGPVTEALIATVLDQHTPDHFTTVIRAFPLSVAKAHRLARENIWCRDYRKVVDRLVEMGILVDTRTHRDLFADRIAALGLYDFDRAAVLAAYDMGVRRAVAEALGVPSPDTTLDTTLDTDNTPF